MKKIFLILCIFTIFFNISVASIADDCGKVLVNMNLLAGYPDGTLKLENNITRAEFSVLIMKMLGYTSDNIDVASKVKFKDLKESHWAYKSVMKATELGYLSGYEDGTFRPSNNLTYAECGSIIVNILGYKTKLKGSWPNNVLTMVDTLKINTNLANKLAKDLVSRGEVSIMLVNSLKVELN